MRHWYPTIFLTQNTCSASCHFLQAQESLLESRICSESPSAQEPPSAIDVALVIALVHSAFQQLIRSLQLVSGSSKRAGILGGRCIPLCQIYGKYFKKETTLLQPLLTFCLLHQQTIVFALCQTSPWSSPLPSPWQPLQRPCLCHARLTVTVTV